MESYFCYVNIIINITHQNPQSLVGVFELSQKKNFPSSKSFPSLSFKSFLTAILIHKLNLKYRLPLLEVPGKDIWPDHHL